MAKQLAKGASEKRLRTVLGNVERTTKFIRREIVQMGNLAEVLDHWGGLIRLTQTMSSRIIDSEQWVLEIDLAVQAMTKRTLFAAKKLRSIIAAHKKNGAEH